MKNLIIILLVIVIVISLFSLIIIIRDLIHDKNETKTIIIEVKKEIEPPIEKPSSVEKIEGVKTFISSPKLTHIEKYQALHSEKKSWYDEIISYAKNKENIKHNLTEQYEDIKLYGKKVVRMIIKREEIICEYILGNHRFNHYKKQKNLSVKILPTQLKIDSMDAVHVAKESIDLTIQSILDERNEKKEEKKKKRLKQKEEQKHEN